MVLSQQQEYGSVLSSAIYIFSCCHTLQKKNLNALFSPFQQFAVFFKIWLLLLLPNHSSPCLLTNNGITVRENRRCQLAVTSSAPVQSETIMLSCFELLAPMSPERWQGDNWALANILSLSCGHHLTSHCVHICRLNECSHIKIRDVLLFTWGKVEENCSKTDFYEWTCLNE